MTHRYSVGDVVFQVQANWEFTIIQNEFMVDSSKLEWLLTTALAQQIQHRSRL